MYTFPSANILGITLCHMVLSRCRVWRAWETAPNELTLPLFSVVGGKNANLLQPTFQEQKTHVHTWPRSLDKFLIADQCSYQDVSVNGIYYYYYWERECEREWVIDSLAAWTSVLGPATPGNQELNVFLVGGWHGDSHLSCVSHLPFGVCISRKLEWGGRLRMELCHMWPKGGISKKQSRRVEAVLIVLCVVIWATR